MNNSGPTDEQIEAALLDQNLTFGSAIRLGVFAAVRALFAASPSPTSSAPAEPPEAMCDGGVKTRCMTPLDCRKLGCAAQAALASSVPPEQQREHKGLS